MSRGWGEGQGGAEGEGGAEGSEQAAGQAQVRGKLLDLPISLTSPLPAAEGRMN